MTNEIIEELYKLKDEKYAEFNRKLCPDTKYEMIGIRIPQIRKLAQKIVKDENMRKDLLRLKDEYFEEVILQGLVIAYTKENFENKKAKIEKFIPKIDSWAICDTFVPTLKIKNSELKDAWEFTLKYVNSKKEFEVRFSVIMMLDYFIMDEYVDKVIETLDKIKIEKYYSQMAIAWCLAEIGIKYNEKLMKYLPKSNLNKFTHNKAIQKMIESYRITDEQKNILREMKKS